MDYAAVKDNYTPAAERNAAPASIGRTDVYKRQAHHKNLCGLYRELLADVEGITLHENPSGDVYKRQVPDRGFASWRISPSVLC